MKQFICTVRTILSILLISAFCNNSSAQVNIVKAYPDSIIKDISNQPIGINLDFLMDGGRFPNAKHSVKEGLKKMGVIRKRA